MSLFESDGSPIHLSMQDADVVYYPDFFDHIISDKLFNKLLTETHWQQDHIKVFGKTHLQPRLTALYANNNNPYKYSNIVMQPTPFTQELLWIKKKIEPLSKVLFTTCLINLYRNGQDSNGWHADDEKELGSNPVIASVSLGQERWFHLKHKTHKNLKTKLLLEHGSLLIMSGSTQHHWLHQIPKTKTLNNPRINLTYRVIK